MMQKDSTIFVAGSDTMIGQALVRQLREQGYKHVLTTDIDLTQQQAVTHFFEEHRPEFMFVAAGKSGGIGANQKYPADLMINNLLVISHLLQSAHQHGVHKSLYLASSCVYPKHTAQPMQTHALMTDTLEPTNEAYATAKLAGIQLSKAYAQQYDQSFVSVIPANNFGVGDDFDPEDSHVVGALIHKMHLAKVNNDPTVPIWGTGSARREFIYVDDLADACIFIMQHYDDSAPLNIGSGVDLSIAELAKVIQEVVGYEGELDYDTSKPDGMPLKMLDSTTLQEMGWQAKTPLKTALQLTYDWYLKTVKG